jgi:predicted NBD/HSP70 family sugar kinase
VPEILERAAPRRSRAAADTLERYVTRAARGLAAIINVLDPDVIVVGGGLSNIDLLYGSDPAALGSLGVSRLAGETRCVRASFAHGMGIPAACEAPHGCGLMRDSKAFRPALVVALRDYVPRTFVSDLIAGVTVGLCAAAGDGVRDFIRACRRRPVSTARL